MKPLRAVLRWWIVTDKETGNFVRVLAGGKHEAQSLGGKELRMVSFYRDLKAEELK